MAMTPLITTDDLLYELNGSSSSAGGGTPEVRLAKLAADDYVAGTTTLLSADVAARLTRWIDDESRYCKNRLGDNVDLSDDEVAADVRRLVVVRVLYRAYCRRGHYSEPANPFAARKKEVDAELLAIKEGRQKVGAQGSQTAALQGWASSSDNDTDYTPLPHGGGGRARDILRKM